ncbi:MAG: PIN domain-containing protein [Oscillospiraceae bacterium]|jgi:predicted nucleic acid-binding protein|nr:PIN domain-containing protein [Oscillospiraceae bacterium]
MKKFRIYLDTSVISHLDAPDTPDKMGDTLKLWKDVKASAYDVYISDLTIAELEDCAEPKRTEMLSALLDIEYTRVVQDERAKQLSALYFEVGGLPPKSKEDAAHIAIASVYDCDIILSWNFKHIVNLRAMTAVETVNFQMRYKNIRILSPSMLLSEEE